MQGPSLGRRLIMLPGQLLLALVNATALLVIAACVLVLVVLSRVDAAGERIAGTVTDAALARLQVTPEDFRSRLVAINSRMDDLAMQLQNPELQDHWEVSQQLKALNQTLTGLKQAAEGLGAAGPEVTNAAFDQAGTMLTRSLYSLRGCSLPEPKD